MKPKWQKARIIRAIRAKDGGYFGIGAEIWVEAKAPELHGGPTIYLHHRIVRPSYQTNIVAPTDDPVLKRTDKKNLAAQCDGLELLPDFADDVPLIPWKQFLAECRPADSQTTRVPE